MAAHDILTFAGSLAILLVVGDLASTFLYHVPQHIWGKLHLRTHHDNTRSFWEHSIVSKDPGILLDGFLGVLPYFVVAAILSFFGRAAMVGALTGIAIGWAHVFWRHTCEIGWRSSPGLKRFARTMQLVLPEDHNGHHKNPDAEFGDLFRFYDAPARALLRRARGVLWRQRRLARIRVRRAARAAHRSPV